MTREIVNVQIGQCGNQLGLKWWDVMLQEYKAHPQYTDACNAVFYDSNNRGGVGDSSAAVDETNNKRRGVVPSSSLSSSLSLRARCVAIDMEEGVLHSMLRGPLKHLFDNNFFVSDVSGAGNNFGVGHMEYGDQYIDSIADTVRRQVELCDCIQAFFVLHSLSGGTGSGLGTRVLGMLEEEFPHVFRISPVVLPSIVDDVVTAPYNACFALRHVIEHADCVLPLDNDALAKMIDTAQGMRGERIVGRMPMPNADSFSNSGGNREGGARQNGGSRNFNAAVTTSTRGLPFDEMNGLVAQLLSNITCAMRFPGPLNMDINEITTNLVPYPRLNFLVSSLAPLRIHQKSISSGARSVDAMILSCLSNDHRFVSLPSHPTSSYTSLANALIARGPQITIGDLRRNITSLHSKLQLPYWNPDGFKTAICGVSPLGHTNSMLMLSNNCGIAKKLDDVYQKFKKLYTVRSHVHHYEPYFTDHYFEDTLETIKSTIEDYQYLDTSSEAPPSGIPRTMKDLLYF